MKKISLWLLVLTICVSMVASFSFVGCKEEAAATGEEVEEEEVEEEEVAEEEVAEESSIFEEITILEQIEKWEEYTNVETKTTGPNGEKPIWFSEILRLTEDEIKQVREVNAKVAFICQDMHVAEEARVEGGKQALEELNMELISVTDCEMDPAKQQINIESVMALNPDAITSLAIDPVQAAEAFRPAVEDGIILSFMSGVPAGYTMGIEYAGMATDDCYGMGQTAAEILAQAIRDEGQEGKIGFVYHGVTFWNTNEWDKGFKETIESMPDMEIVAEQGFVTNEDVEGIVSAMITQHPEINGIYSSFNANAEYALAAIRAAERPDIKLTTNEFTEVLALDMAQDGNFVGASMDVSYLLGYVRTYLLAWGLLGKVPESFAIVPAVSVTKENIEEHWFESYRFELPDNVLDALE